nr:hypothetical protein [uncultured Psychrobacter sp.]
MNYKRIIIDSSKLREIINNNYPRHNKNTFSYFSLFITLLVTLTTIETFKDFGDILSSLQIKIILWFLACIFLILTIWEFFKKPPYSKETVISEIEKESLNITKNVALFVFMKTFIKEDIKEIKFLFSNDFEWSSYLLPFCKKHDNHTLSQLTNFIESQLSLEKNSVSLDKIDFLTFDEEKSSATSGKLTQYSYDVYFVVYDSEKNIHLEDEIFHIGERSYEWLSLDKVKNHSKTMYLNRKVIRMIDDNFSMLLMDYKLPNDNRH